MDHKIAPIRKERIYYKTIKSSKEKAIISENDSFLVVCGGHTDKKVLEANGLANVTISNLDDRLSDNEFSPYKYSYQDAENLSFEDACFDWVIVHAGLHHCYRPHLALHEMLRVAKKGAIVFEARDNTIIKFGKKLRIVPTYEIEAVIGNNMKYGGVANTDIPNFIYRWTESEVDGVLNSLYPIYSDNKVHYFYNLRLPTDRIKVIVSPFKRFIMSSLMLPLKLFCFLFPKQSNEFGFIMVKGNKLHPWLQNNNGEIKINPESVKKGFDISNKTKK